MSFFAGIGSALVGGALSLFGGRSQDRNAARQAQAQMDFQERMRATQYQTTVQDMRAAGLNPILATKLGGAGTPSGAAAPMGNPIGDAVNTAMEASKVKAELDNIKADTNTKETLSALQKAQEDFNRVQISLNPYQMRLLQSQAAQNWATETFSNEQTNLSRLQQLKTVVETEQQKHLATSAFWHSKSAEEEYNRLKNFGRSWIGDQGHTLEQMIRRIGRTASENRGTLIPRVSIRRSN